jgi:hypothetical protein
MILIAAAIPKWNYKVYEVYKKRPSVKKSNC